MRRSFTTNFGRHAFLVCLVSALLGLSCIVMGSKRLATAEEPVVVIAPPVADLSTINQGDRRDVLFNVKNNSARIITVVPTTASSCSCVRMVGGAVDLVPGNEHDFHALVDSSSYPGTFEREALFLLKGLEREDVFASATIRAQVVPECSFVPSELRLSAKHPIARTSVVPGFRSDISILNAWCTAPDVTCVVLEGGASVEVALQPSADAKRLRNARVIVKTTSTIEDLKHLPIRSDLRETPTPE